MTTKKDPNPPVTISNTQRGYRPLDLKIALCVGRGLTRAETAEFAGCYIDTVDDRRHKNKEFIEEWADFQKRLDEDCAKKDAEVTKDNLASRLEKQLNNIEKLHAKVILKGLAEGESDPKVLKLAMNAGREVLNRVMGLPTQKIESESTNRQIYEIGPATIAAIAAYENRLASQNLIAAPEGDVIDVEGD